MHSMVDKYELHTMIRTLSPLMYRIFHVIKNMLTPVLRLRKLLEYHREKSSFMTVFGLGNRK